MVNPTLREIIDDAIVQVDTYKHPQLDDFKSAIKPILVALQGSAFADHDDIVGISIYDDEVIVSTEYYVRCCQQTDDFRIPLEIINSTDPVNAATEYRLRLDVDNFKTDMDRQSGLAAKAKTKYDEAVKKYAVFKRG